jgi:hypothetical protein
LAEKRRFQIQLSRFWTKNDDFKSDFGVFAGRTAISSPNFPFLDVRTEILNPAFWILAGEIIFSRVNRSYSQEKDFPRHAN